MRDQRQRVSQTRTTEAVPQRSASATATPLLATHARAHPILQLQQSIGNQAVQRLLRSRTIQAKHVVQQSQGPSGSGPQLIQRTPLEGVDNMCVAYEDR